MRSTPTLTLNLTLNLTLTLTLPLPLGALNADMAAAYSEHKSASAPQYAFKSGLTHTYVNYKVSSKK